jgi:hypothetical protein
LNHRLEVPGLISYRAAGIPQTTFYRRESIARFTPYRASDILSFAAENAPKVFSLSAHTLNGALRSLTKKTLVRRKPPTSEKPRPTETGDEARMPLDEIALRLLPFCVSLGRQLHTQLLGDLWGISCFFQRDTGPVRVRLFDHLIVHLYFLLSGLLKTVYANYA